MRRDFARLCSAPPRVVARALMEGGAPGLDALAGWEFRGWYSPPSLPSILLPKHRKGFYGLRDGGGAALGGYLVPCRRGNFRTPWVSILVGPGSARGGWFLASPASGGRYPGSVVIDYGRAGRVPPWNPLGFVREYLVQPWPDDPDVLVSAVELRAGTDVRHLGTCVLERDGRSPVGL